MTNKHIDSSYFGHNFASEYNVSQRPSEPTQKLIFTANVKFDVMQTAKNSNNIFASVSL